MVIRISEEDASPEQILADLSCLELRALQPHIAHTTMTAGFKSAKLISDLVSPLVVAVLASGLH